MRKKKEKKSSLKAVLFSLVFLAIALYSNSLAGEYSNKAGNSSPGDIILDNIKPVDLSFIYIWLNLISIAVIFLYPVIYKRERFYYYVNMVSMFIIVRAVFTTLTHLQLPSDAITPSYPGIIQAIHFKNDLFFSGHAGLPFLGFLIFKNKKLRYFFLASSIILGIVVLLMHVHYTIDVFAAYFITYGVYKIGNKVHFYLEKRKK